MTDEPVLQDPISYLPPGFAPDDGTKWAERHWLNVPGPFYTGQTDTCWTGRQSAPHHVLYGGEYYNEFIYRQPKTRTEVECIVAAALADPFDGYEFDGDARWTPEAVRAWWDLRGRAEEHVLELISEWTRPDADPGMLEAAEGARDFLGYIHGGLETDLQSTFSAWNRAATLGPESFFHTFDTWPPPWPAIGFTTRRQATATNAGLNFIENYTDGPRSAMTVFVSR